MQNVKRWRESVVHGSPSRDGLKVPSAQSWLGFRDVHRRAGENK